jgi:cysteinyl-tRNA synthetase
VIHLYDTLEGEVRTLALRDEGRVGIYLCGPTVYDLPHLGHGRHALVWDVLRRWLTFEGYEVNFVSNVTDIDDKIIARAAREDTSEETLAKTYEDEWWRALEALGVAPPTHTPHATAYVEEMIELIGELLALDVAYVLDDGVYFDVSRVADYGRLSGQSLESLRAGARVEANEAKRSPLDFTLWKNAKVGEPSWEAPFGAGRPGWHTECVVMSLALLGEGFDLHCGGLDLKFPHHENERAQAGALSRPFAQHWAHHGWVMVGEEKMSKSLDNFTSLTDLLANTDPRAYRLLVLRSHYRSPLEVTPETIADAERSLERLDALARRFTLAPLAGETLEVASDFDFSGAAGVLRARVASALDDDLDTAQALAKLFDATSQANVMADKGDPRGAAQLARAIGALCGAMGLRLHASVDEVDETSADLARARDDARASGDFAEADRLRDELARRGWLIEDSPTGSTLRRS